VKSGEHADEITDRAPVDQLFHPTRTAVASTRKGLQSAAIHPLSTDDIEAIASQDDVQTATTKLVNAALDADGPDNVTVILVDPVATPQTEAARARAQVMDELFLFRGLPFYARLRVSRICREITFDGGEVLVREGDTGGALYVIVQGEVVVARAGHELARLGPGEHFGELALIDEHTRTAIMSPIYCPAAMDRIRGWRR
jgi:hypothetical protein